MSNENQKRTNRNNRKRGSSFEKKVADYLGFDVVPYSGSNARFGYGDVRGDEWLIECKNITPDGDKITIKMGWIYKNRERAYDVDKMSAIAWMARGKSDKFILLEYKDFSSFGISEDISVPLTPKTANTKNLIFHMSEYYIKDIRDGLIVEFVTNGVSYYMMNIEKFKSLIDDRNSVSHR